MTTWPAVTCLCPTYGRFELLRLALACFLAQDYPGEKQLLVLNDAEVPIELAGSLQPLEYDKQTGVWGDEWVPDYLTVEVRNVPAFSNLGAKRQALLLAATTPLVAHWDDDDLYLPHHLTRGVGALLDAEAGCVKSRGAWYLRGREVRGVHHNVFEGSMVFRREEALGLGGYPPLHSGQAKALMDAFDREGRLYKIPDDEGGGPSYVYRWAQGCGHISSFGNDPDALAFFQCSNNDFGHGRPLTPGDLAPWWKLLRAAGANVPEEARA